MLNPALTPTQRFRFALALSVLCTITAIASIVLAGLAYHEGLLDDSVPSAALRDIVIGFACVFSATCLKVAYRKMLFPYSSLEELRLYMDIGSAVAHDAEQRNIIP